MPEDLQQQIHDLIERAQRELLDASRHLADELTKESSRYLPPLSHDVERIVDDAFDFAERVLKGQRKMVNDLVHTLNEEARRGAQVSRRAVATRVPGHKSAAKKRAAASKATAKKAGAKKTTTKKATKATATKRRAAKKTTAKRTTG